MFGATSTNQRSWESLYFPCGEDANTGLYSANGVTVVTAPVVGEVCTGGGGGSSRIEVMAPVFTVGGYPTVVYRLLDGTITAGETFTGAIAANFSLYGGGYDQIPTLADNRKNIIIPGIVGTSTTCFDFSTANGVGTDNAYRQGISEFYLRDAMPTLGTQDFILQVVASLTNARLNFEFRVGGNIDNQYVCFTETNYRCGMGTGDQLIAGGHLTDWPQDSLVHTRALCRRGNQISAVEETDGTDFFFRSSTPGMKWQAMSPPVDITISQGISFSAGAAPAADNPVYGVLLAVFPDGLPSDSNILAGLKDHYTRWPTGDKTLTEIWGY